MLESSGVSSRYSPPDEITATHSSLRQGRSRVCYYAKSRSFFVATIRYEMIAAHCKRQRHGKIRRRGARGPPIRGGV
jgi:hypothetical protein